MSITTSNSYFVFVILFLEKGNLGFLSIYWSKLLVLKCRNRDAEGN